MPLRRAQSALAGSLRWVRPLQSIVCTFGPETEEPAIIDFEIAGIRSGNVTPQPSLSRTEIIKVYFNNTLF
ncbi:MAG: hypothetical protein U5K75_10125, partial [Ahrensia sp.]|nr:hypothetical protein [Ahrensia sp.]